MIITLFIDCTHNSEYRCIVPTDFTKSDIEVLADNGTSKSKKLCLATNIGDVADEQMNIGTIF